MKTFLKRTLQLSIIALIGLGIWGYKNGLRQDNYQEFFKVYYYKIQTKIIELLDTDQPSEDKKDEKKDSKPKQKKTKTEKDDTSPLEKDNYTPLPIDKNPFQAIDNHARNCPKSETTDVNRLAKYLQQYAKTDLEKARAIYVWITHNISYDDDSFNSKNYPDYTPEYVLQHRKAICNGFSRLYYAIGKAMNLPIEKVSGYAKGYSYSPKRPLTQEDLHAWNIIKIKGEWKIFDATWGSGYGNNVNGKLVSTKKFNENWFNVDPYQAIFSHLPHKETQQFVKPLLNKSLFEKLPQLNINYLQMGLDAKDLYQKLYTYPRFQFPKSYPVDSPVKILKAPITGFLSPSKTYEFEFFIPRGIQMALEDPNGKWTLFKRDKGYFSLGYTPKTRGMIRIMVQLENQHNKYSTILKYKNKIRE